MFYSDTFWQNIKYEIFRTYSHSDTLILLHIISRIDLCKKIYIILFLKNADDFNMTWKIEEKKFAIRFYIKKWEKILLHPYRIFYLAIISKVTYLKTPHMFKYSSCTEIREKYFCLNNKLKCYTCHSR